jgi:drug/metabolite transporter (DMT)-like permease
VGAARIFLKEKLSPQFAVVLLVALGGAFMIAWPNLSLTGIDPQMEFRAVTAAIGAALLWGICTVAGRHLTTQFGFLEMTALRYFVATIILLPTLAVVGELPSLSQIPALDWLWFLLMAWGPGYLALVIYYKGLQGTRASVATLCELSFPVGAVLVNWLFLDSPLTMIQGLGALFLVGSVTWLSFEQAQTQKVGNVEVPFE